MHVLLTADTVGGVWTYARELVTGLVRRGVQRNPGELRRYPDAGTKRVAGSVSATWISARPRFAWSGCRSSALTSRPLPSTCRPSSTRVKPDLLAPQPVLLWRACGGYPKDRGGAQRCRELVGMRYKERIPHDIPWIALVSRNRAAWPAGGHGGGCALAMDADAGQRYYGALPNRERHLQRTLPSMFNPHMSKSDSSRFGRAIMGCWQAGLVVAAREAAWPVTIAGTEQHPEQTSSARDRHLRLANRELRPYAGPQSEGQCVSCSAELPSMQPLRVTNLSAWRRLRRPCRVARWSSNDLPSFREIWGDAACYFDANERRLLIRLPCEAGREIVNADVTFAESGLSTAPGNTSTPTAWSTTISICTSSSRVRTQAA